MKPAEMMERQKLIKKASNGKNKTITVTHINIRQSIFFMLLKLFAIEILAALCFLFYQINVVPNNLLDSVGFASIEIPIFIFAVCLKTFFTFFIIIQWLEEYYEITPNEIIHRNGLIFKREKSFKLDHLGSLEIEQGVLGRMFNYGTLELYNWALDRKMYLYLIHNPRKYHKILDDLLPEVDAEKEMFREKFIELESDE